MRKTLFLLICFAFNISGYSYANEEIKFLLMELDQTIVNRAIYTEKRVFGIDSLKFERNNNLSLIETFRLNEKIIAEYESFTCDSAITYITKNIEIATILNDKELIYQSKLQHSFVLSLSGAFTQALENLNEINYEELPSHLKTIYCWTYIRYYENLIKYTDDPQYEKIYFKEKMHYRDLVLSFLDKESELYIKELGFKYQDEGNYKDACKILLDIFAKQDPKAHSYAMSAMSLALVYRAMGDKELENIYLIKAAITDIKLAVKENEALLALAINLHKEGDVDRSYNYIRAALDDANFYNSRFKNTMIARVQPIIEDTYINKIEQQQQNLRLYAIIISIFVIVLIIFIYFIYKQVKTVSKAKRNLKDMNEKLANINQMLDEANIIKEKYIAYFMNLSSIYLDKLDDYRKNINRKLKAGQVEELYKLTSSTRNIEKEVEELYKTFDKAFFKIYPNFVEEFNALLKEEAHYKLEKEQLNNELRIFALIRLGITDVNQIATFLRYSIQTIYNYKSKVKGKAIIDSDIFEEEVKKIGTFSSKGYSKPSTQQTI